MSTQIQELPENKPKAQPFRLDVQLRDLLQKPEGKLSLIPPPPSARLQKLPIPIFPQRPELLTNAEIPADIHGSPTDPYKRH
jgi:hypothetical protein